MKKSKTKIVSNKTISELIFKITNIFFLVGILMSFNLWFKIDRKIPFISIIDCHNLSYVSVFMSFVLTITLLLNVFIKKRLLIIITIINLVVLLFLDRMKCQPWVYFYALTLILFIFKKSKNNSSYFYLTKYLLGIMYFWAGVHKLSPSFVSSLSNLFTRDFDKIKAFFYVFPYLEILMGLIIILFPLNKLLRNFFTAFHLLVALFVLLTNSINAIVVPWNIYFAILIVLLSYIDVSKEFLKPIENTKTRILIVVFSCLPILNFYSKFDHYFSFSLYSGKIPQLFIIFPKEKITPVVNKYFNNSFLVSEESKKLITSIKEVEIVSFYKLTNNTLNIPPVMEKDVIDYMILEFDKKFPEAETIVYKNK